MKTSTNTQIIKLNNITGQEALSINLQYPNHKERYEVLKNEYAKFGKFHSNPKLNEKYEVVFASMEILVLKELGITEYEFEIVPINPLQESEIYFSSLLDNLKLTNIEKAILIGKRTKALEDLGVNNTTSVIAKENNICKRSVQKSKNIDKLPQYFKKTLLESGANIGINELEATSKLTPEQQKKLNEKIKKEIENKNTTLNNKSYKNSLENVKNTQKKETPKQSIFDKVNRLYANAISQNNKAKLTNNEDILMEQLKLITDKYISLKSEKETFQDINTKEVDSTSKEERVKNDTKTLSLQPENKVLAPWLGGKGKSSFTISEQIKKMNMKKVVWYIEPFCGLLGFTIHQIDKVEANNYVINDKDPILYATYKAIKEDHKKVQEVYTEIREGYFELVPPELKDMNTIEPENLKDLSFNERKIARKDFRKNYMFLKDYYTDTINQLNTEKDIFKIAAIFIWAMGYSPMGILKYNNDGSIASKSFTWKNKIKSKVNQIAYYSQILNKYDVIIENLEVFDLLKKYPNPNSFWYMDPPYFSDTTKMNYNAKNDLAFHKDLLMKTSHIRYRLYSNEVSNTLYSLNVDKIMPNHITFERNNCLTGTKEIKDVEKAQRMEFLGFSINEKSYLNNQKIV